MNLVEFLIANSYRTIHGALGIEVLEATATRVRLSVPITERVHQYTGILHGGVSVVLAESAASIGAAINTDLAEYTPVGVEINANHLRSVSKGTIFADATPVYIGKQMSVWSIEVRDDRDRLICIARCTMALKPGAATPPNQ